MLSLTVQRQLREVRFRRCDQEAIIFFKTKNHDPTEQAGGDAESVEEGESGAACAEKRWAGAELDGDP